MKNFLCEVCGKFCKLSKRLKEHLKDKHGPLESRICIACGKIFKNARSVQRHIAQQHTNPREKVACDNCNAKVYKANLHQHEKICIPHQCGICKRVFLTRGSLQNHVKTHKK